jgi:hypothetical protein
MVNILDGGSEGAVGMKTKLRMFTQASVNQPEGAFRLKDSLELRE